MNRNWIYFILLLLVGFATYWYVFRDEVPQYDKSEANFTVKDTNDIQAIFLSNIKNENIKISRKGNTWVLNDSLRVRLDVVAGLLHVLKHQYAEKPVPAMYHDRAVKELSAISTKVEIYDKKGKTNCFYVGQTATEENSTYMLNEGAKRPFVVKLPMENNFVGRRYFTQIENWRDKKILFDVSPIERIQVKYKDSMQYDFTVQVKEDSSILVEGNITSDSVLNVKRAKSYVNIYKELYCTGYELKYIHKDSILQFGKQLANITCKRKQLNPETLTILYKPVSHDTKLIINMGNQEFEGNYFFGWLNNRDFIVLDRKSVVALLRKGQEFYEKD